MGEQVIYVEQLIKYYGDYLAIDKISFAVKKGEIFGIVGPDGAGKTTLLRLLTGVLQQYEGHILLFNEDNTSAAVKSRIGYMPQRFSLYKNMSVIENLQLMGALYGLDLKNAVARIENMLKFVGLWQFKDRFAGDLSGGMKQKLALSAAVLHQPKILFLDEPGTGVDPVARREFWQLLYEFNQQGMTVVIATPYMDEAEFCHRLLFLQQGKMLTCKTPREITDDFLYTVLLLKSSVKEIPELVKGCYFKDIEAFSDTYHIVTDDPAKTKADLSRVLGSIGTYHLSAAVPSLEDAFVLLAEGDDGNGNSD